MEAVAIHQPIKGSLFIGISILDWKAMHVDILSRSIWEVYTEVILEKDF